VKEVDLDGILFAPIAGNLILAIVVYYFVLALLPRLRLEGNVWHPQLFKFCLFVVILCLLTFSIQ
jgi:hypothetical protein